MLLFWPNWLFLYPGLFLMLAGLVVGGGLALESREVLGIRFNLGTMLYCMTAVEVGFQATLFAILSRAWAVQEGLMPQSLRMRRIERYMTLENGILPGLLLLGTGLGLGTWAISIWLKARFGNLNVERIARIIIGSSLTLSLGSEVLLSSFLLSTLRLNIHLLRA